jgi:hypothetical protein
VHEPGLDVEGENDPEAGDEDEPCVPAPPPGKRPVSLRQAEGRRAATRPVASIVL